MTTRSNNKQKRKQAVTNNNNKTNELHSPSKSTNTPESNSSTSKRCIGNLLDNFTPEEGENDVDMEDAATAYKKVNYKSRNRRQKTTTQEDNSSVGTLDRTNRTQHRHSNISRFTLKLSIVASEDPKATTLSTFQDLLAELFKADEKCQIYPWKDSDNSRRIKTPKMSPLPMNANYF